MTALSFILAGEAEDEDVDGMELAQTKVKAMIERRGKNKHQRLCKRCGKGADHYKHDGTICGLDAHPFVSKEPR